jgi:3-keto-L-gulonate-6-phosphate decarboxylase
LVGVAVKVTDVPAQMVVADALILTDGVTEVTMEIVTGADVTTVTEGHTAVEVICTENWSPSLMVEVV